MKTIIRAKGLGTVRSLSIMVEEPVVKTPPPTQHISFDDEEAKIATEIPKLTGLTHPDLSGEEIQEFVQKYNIEIAYSPEDNFHQMSY